MTTLIEVKQAQLQARKNRESIKTALLTTVIGEVQNRVTNKPVDSRNAEVENSILQEVLNSFLKKNREAQDTVRGEALEVLKNEAQIITSFQPKRLNEVEVMEILKKKSPNLEMFKNMDKKDKGRVIGDLRREHGELVDSFIVMKVLDSLG